MPLHLQMLLVLTWKIIVLTCCIGLINQLGGKEFLKDYCMFCDTEYEAVVKYVSVRWLCLERCLDRELKKYHAPKSYFLSEHESDNRLKRLNESFQRPMSEIYLVFSISNCLVNQFQQVFAKGRSSHILDAYTDGNFPKQVGC